MHGHTQNGHVRRMVLVLVAVAPPTMLEGKGQLWRWLLRRKEDKW
jgi:hypothetical protein